MDALLHVLTIIGYVIIAYWVIGAIVFGLTFLGVFVCFIYLAATDRPVRRRP